MSIMSKLFCRDDIGIDLGAANMRVWVRGKGLVMDEPSVVALPRSCHFGSEPRILAVGTEAAKLMGESDNVRKSGMGFMPQQECSSLALVRLVLCLMAAEMTTGCLSYSHYRYARRAEAAQARPEGVTAKPGRIYFASFPENCLALSIWGWHPNVGHASLVTNDKSGTIKQYDYGWFVGHEGGRPTDAIGYVDESASYGVVRRKSLPAKDAAKATNDLEVARKVLEGMPGYGDTVELWAKDVDDIGIAERYMEQLAEDKDRGSMAWRCWQIGGYRCGNITRQAFDAARGEGHFLDLLWGGFPGADAPSIGTDKTTWTR